MAVFFSFIFIFFPLFLSLSFKSYVFFFFFLFFVTSSVEKSSGSVCFSTSQCDVTQRRTRSGGFCPSFSSSLCDCLSVSCRSSVCQTVSNEATQVNHSTVADSNTTDSTSRLLLFCFLYDLIIVYIRVQKTKHPKKQTPKHFCFTSMKQQSSHFT